MKAFSLVLLIKHGHSCISLRVHFREGFERLKGALGFHIAPSEKARMHYRDIKRRNLQHTNSAHVPAWDCVCAVTSEQLMLRYHRQTTIHSDTDTDCKTEGR